MSYYYKYKFESPEPLFARVKEELKSYFDAGVVDDLMFPVWTKKCLQKLGRGSYPILETLLFVDSFQAKLPPDWVAPREVWLTATITPFEFRRPGSYYQQITTVLNKPYDVCNPALNCDPCNPDILTVVAKTDFNIINPIRLKHLLRPGTSITRDHCTMPHLEPHSPHSVDSMDTYDIRDGKMIVHFRCGDIYLRYYALQTTDDGSQLIPENYRIQEYIEAFIKQKLFEQVFNQPSDESFQQSQAKYQFYKQMADEAYIIAETESKKKTAWERAYAIRRDEHRNDIYNKMIYGSPWRWRGGGWPASSWGFND